jgi:hypothetical protein
VRRTTLQCALCPVPISFVFAGVFPGSDDLTSGPFDAKIAQGIGYQTGMLRQAAKWGWPRWIMGETEFRSLGLHERIVVTGTGC